MRGERDYLGGLARLHLVETTEDRRAEWRQGMATLARAVSDDQGAPLEGIQPEALLAGVRAAFNGGLIDDLDWLSPAAGAAAMYELASALPDGFERRELGRRVLQRLRQGDAATFVSVATLLAQGPTRALSGPQIRARVALSLDLPFGLGVRADALALALISRRDLQREWLTVPATGSLPSRRLAARLLERAAREAARRSAAGDETGVRIFGTESVRAAWRQLLDDRESLVWRHVAVARGLLTVAIPELAAEVERHLDPGLSPTEWRRAAASLAGAIAVQPEEAAARGAAMLQGPLLKLDRGIASAMVLGLPRAAEVEPAAVEELLESLIRAGSVAAAESLVELRHERIGEGYGIWASKLARQHLREAATAVKGLDDGKSALVEALEAELRPEPEQSEPTLRDRITRALDAFAAEGAPAAYDEALEALENARSIMTFLEECQGDDAHGRRWAFRALRELDTGLLETATLSDLLTLGARAGEPSPAAAPLGELFERLTRWLLARESETHRAGAEIPHLSLRLRQLRTLLHLVDADGSYGDDPGGDLRGRRLRVARVLLRRVREDAPSPMRRTVTAAAARALDALVREEIFGISDALIATGVHLRERTDLVTLSEASMVPELVAVARAYAELAAVLDDARQDDRARTRASLKALHQLAHELPLASSRRVEALRTALRGFASTLKAVADAASIRELGEGGESGLLLRFEASARTLAQLVAGALRRLDPALADAPPQCAAALRLVDFGLERSLRGSPASLDESLGTALELLDDELPAAVAQVARLVLDGIRELPTEGTSEEPKTKTRTLVPVRPPLPPWLPPSRTIGGFYVLHALGFGAAASVFVVTRADERGDPGAERLALKVPEYDGSAALTLSEAQFLQHFREEARALLSLPAHPNLARFVTFDVGARPKPILVMELVEGPTLERLLSVGDLTVEHAFAVLDGIAAGLEAMHHVGVGHLDLKPANVILRAGSEVAVGLDAAPVLVDFGLAGRVVRPGCGTPNYAAPEVWGLIPARHQPAPWAVDVYALGCLAYETLTGKVLFEGSAVGDFQTAHISHDGGPRAIEDLGRQADLAPLAMLLSSMLRQDPRDRRPISAVRADLAAIGARLAHRSWPLGLSDDTVPGIKL